MADGHFTPDPLAHVAATGFGTPDARPIFYARRGFCPATHERVTFVSDDEKDCRPRGWFKGWREDDAEYDAHRLVHVYERSWRVSAPQQFSAVA